MANNAQFDGEVVESAVQGGLILMAASFLGVVIANTPWAADYFAFWEWKVAGLSMLHWVNDLLMTIFFLQVGLEIKREIKIGELNKPSQRLLPGLAAFFGLAVPALIYIGCNWVTPVTLRGWAIPAATDIAFTLGVVALLGRRVPASLKIFVTALAIIDDLLAVLIIAFFYSSGLAWAYLAVAAVVFVILLGMDQRRVVRPWPYIILGAVLWFCMLRSGIHATLAGVLLAMTIPLKGTTSDGVEKTPLTDWEHILTIPVTYFILPLFGFANAGVSFAGMSADMLADPIVIGVAAGLFIGKPIGIFSTVYILIRAGWAKMPKGATWGQLWGVAMLCGIGFTMSLFITMLAFGVPQWQDHAKIGVFAGSILSGVCGYLWLRYGTRSQAPARTSAS